MVFPTILSWQDIERYRRYVCDMGECRTGSMNMVQAFGRTPFSLDQCHGSEQRLYFLS